MRLELKHLRLVCSISETGQLTRAAGQLYLSQPALSKQLAELEGRLGFALFHRSRQAMSPTEAGVAFYRHARRILDDVAVLDDYLAEHLKGEATRLRLSVDRLHRAAWLPAWLAQMRALFPQLELQVRQVPDLLQSLRQRDSDLLVVGETSPAPEFEFHPLHAHDEMVMILPPGHQLAARPWLEAADLAGQHLLYHFELKQSLLYRRYLHPQQIRLGSLQHIEDVSAIVALVRAGAGISLLPRALLDGGEQGMLVRAIGAQGFHFDWYAAHERGERRPVVIEGLRLLRQLLRAGPVASA